MFKRNAKARFSARRAACWSASTIRPATTAAGAIQACGDSLRRCARLGNDLGFVNIVTGGTIIMYVLSLILSRQGIQIVLAARRRRCCYFLGASGASPVVRARLVVDRPHRRLAARRHPAHLFQRDVDPPARSRDRQPVRRGPHGDHLHHRRHRRLHAQLVPRPVRHSVFRRRPDGRRVGLDLRLPRRARALRQPDRQQPRPPGGPSVRALHGHHGIRARRASTTPRTLADSSAAISRR